MDIEKAEHIGCTTHAAGRSRASTSRGRRPILYIFATFVLIFLFFNSVAMRRSSSTTFASSGEALALGFALTPTYGTIAVRNSKGELLTTGKVQGDEQYIQMMRRLSDPSARHLHPPYGSIAEVLADWPRQALRHARSSIGLPSTSDVGRLAALLQQLLASIEPAVGGGASHSGAILALPDIVSLYEEDACDTLAYLGIHDLVGTHIAELHPRAINAAFVGHGLGACEDWRDPEACKEFYRSLPRRNTLLVDYSRGVFSIVWDRLTSGVGISSHVTVDFDAGSDSGVDEGKRLHHLSQQIHAVVDGTLWQAVDVALLTGESADDEPFQNAVRQAIQKYGAPQVYSSDPVFVAAKAASDMAWRAAEIQRLFPDKEYFPCPPT